MAKKQFQTNLGPPPPNWEVWGAAATSLNVLSVAEAHTEDINSRVLFSNDDGSSFCCLEIFIIFFNYHTLMIAVLRYEH